MATDFLDREIQVGDYIVYPQRQSSALWMCYAQVLSIHRTQKMSGGWDSLKIRVLKSRYNNEPYTTTLQVTNRVVVVGHAEEMTKSDWEDKPQ